MYSIHRQRHRRLQEMVEYNDRHMSTDASKLIAFILKHRIILLFAVSLPACIPAVLACSWSYAIWGIRSKTAEPLFRFVRKGKSGYIDSSGRVVIRPTLPDGGNAFGEFHEGLVAVRRDRRHRYVNRAGRTEFETDVWLAFDFSDGLAAASKPGDPPKWGFIDRTGRFVVRPQYAWVEPFSEGLARVAVSREVGSTGYIDKQGAFVIPATLSYGSDFHEGRAAVILGGPCQIINGGSCGRPEFKPTQPRAKYDCRYAFVDKSGRPISDLRFDDAMDFSEGMAPVRIGRLWGYVNRSGQISISPMFESAEPFSEGLAAVRTNGKVGFIDNTGRWMISPQFEAADSFSDGRALVSETRSSGTWISWFIDRDGRRAFPGEFAAATSFRFGLAHVTFGERSSERFAWINTSGKAVFVYSPR